MIIPNLFMTMYKGFATKAIHVAQEPESVTGSVTTPIFQTSTYAQEEIGKHKGFEYARTQNPTRFAWEKNVASLEGARWGYAFGSGMAAIDTVMRLLSSGAHVVCSEDMYGGTFRLFDKVLSRYGYMFSAVDMSDIEAVKAAIRPETAMIYTETPTNPMMRITDIAAMAAIAKQSKALLVVDNTFATPYLQKPLLLGADIVLHSATKYLGGHSDLVSGVVITDREDIAQQIGFLQNAVGAVPGPFEPWLLLRSVKTLALRMEKHQQNAQAIAQLCEQHSKVQRVWYPGLASHPHHDLAAKQMSGFGGMISIEVGSYQQAQIFARAIKVFTLAESLGGVESLLCHPVSMTHGSIPKEKRDRLGITDGLLRLSCGIEDNEDLIADIEQALSLL